MNNSNLPRCRFGSDRVERPLRDATAAPARRTRSSVMRHASSAACSDHPGIEPMLTTPRVLVCPFCADDDAAVFIVTRDPGAYAATSTNRSSALRSRSTCRAFADLGPPDSILDLPLMRDAVDALYSRLLAQQSQACQNITLQVLARHLPSDTLG